MTLLYKKFVEKRVRAVAGNSIEESRFFPSETVLALSGIAREEELAYFMLRNYYHHAPSNNTMLSVCVL